MGSDQMQFAPVQELPLNFLCRLQTDRRRQGQGKADVESGILSSGSDGLHA